MKVWCLSILARCQVTTPSVVVSLHSGRYRGVHFEQTWTCGLLGQWLTNRAPTGKEVASGRLLLEQFLAMYPEATPVAVGRVSQGLLGQMGIAAPAVRHPSMGGASQFREQFAVLAGRPAQ